MLTLFLVQDGNAVLVVGVDEAGRGCIIGPLVVAGVSVPEEKMPDLIALGVKDSKLLTAKKRDSLFDEIIQLKASIKTVKLAPVEIDKAVECQRRLHKLNRLEPETMAQVIQALSPNEVYVDAADVEKRFATHIRECLTIKTKIISRHKADLIYPIVSAASIIAKVERDREIETLRGVFGDFGSGYLHDPKTQGFNQGLAKNQQRLPSVCPQILEACKESFKRTG